MPIDISRALTIPDHRWPTEAELTWLAERAAEHKVICEVGVFCGRSTVAMAENTKGNVFAIDDFYGPRDIDMPNEDRAQILNDFLANTAHLRNVGIFVRDHAEPPAIKGDMIFIDGAHDYESVLRDIRYWQTMLKPGGLLCGHDANWHTTAQAVQEVFGSVHVIEGTNIWIAH